MKNHISPLHYLRGLAALGIMLHHYFGFIRSADHIHERVGIYGVSIFYVLSGMALVHVYSDELKLNGRSLWNFYVKRFFRIYPLMWFALIATLILSRESHGWQDLLLNFTGLFSWVDANAGIPQGVWSIGNELVFYTLFPFLLFFVQGDAKWKLPVLILITLIGLTYSSMLMLDIPKLNPESWAIYVQPWNQIYLFTGGMVLARVLNGISRPQLLLSIALIISLLLFCFVPIGGDSINLIKGWPRVFFSILCMGMCSSLFLMRSSLKGYVHRVLFTLGTISYSLYLLHPIVVRGMIYVESLFFEQFDVYLLGALALVPAIITATLSYRFIEEPFMRLRKRFLR